MAFREDVKITLTVDDKGSPVIKKVNRNIELIGEEAKSTSQKVQQSWTEMNQMFTLVETKLQQVYQAFKKAYEFAREGAELEFTINKFDRLSESIGTTTDALLHDLKEATDGTMSDMKLMAMATDFMTLGLAKTKDQVVRLSSVSSQLGMDMNQLVLALTNQTTARFDQLGVAVTGFDEKVKALEESGMSAQDAFTEAFLQQAEEQIAKVGSVTEETLGTFMRFEAAIENLAVTMKMKAAPASEGLIKILTNGINVLSGNAGWETILEKVNEQVRNGSMSYDDYRLAVNGVLRETGLLIDINGNLFAHTADGILKLNGARKSIDLLSESEVEAAKYTAGWTEENYKAYHGIVDVDDATQQLIDTQARLKEAQMDYKVFLSGELGKENEKYRDTVADLTEKAGELQTKIGELEDKKWLTQEQKEELEELKTKQGELQTAVKATADEHEIATKRILLGYMEQQMAIDGLTEKEMDVLMKVAEKWGLIEEETYQAWEGMKTYTGSIDTAKQSADELAEKLANIQKNIEIDVWLKIHGLDGIQQIATMGGGGSSAGGSTPFVAQAAGGDVRPGGSYIVGEHGIELLQMGYNGQGTITPMSNITNNYNLGVTTTQSLNTVTTGFAILQAMG